MTDRFTATAEAMARATGMPAFPFAVIAHPISNNDDTVSARQSAGRPSRNASRFWWSTEEEASDLPSFPP